MADFTLIPPKQGGAVNDINFYLLQQHEFLKFMFENLDEKNFSDAVLEKLKAQRQDIENMKQIKAEQEVI